MQKIIIPFLILLITLAIYLLTKLLFVQYPKSKNIVINGKNYQLETATNPIQQARGLSSRSNLCSNCGMLFVFPIDTTLPFWMKDTQIPLDIIWINSSGTIVKIVTALPQPNTSTVQLTTYQNDRPAKYVIELNAGESLKIGLHEGDTINL